MAIDLSKEQPLSLGAATAFVPRRRGRRVSAATIWRWIVTGKKGIKLEAMRSPSGWWTTRQAIERFYLALSHLDGRGAVSEPPKPSEADRARSVAWARKVLDDAGI